MQCVLKIYGAVNYTEDFKWAANFLLNLYKIHITTKSRERAEYFKTCSLYTEYLFIFMAILYFTSTFAILIYPLYMYFFENEVVPVMPIYLPLVDETTHNGYIILTTFHLVVFYMAVSGLFLFDFLLAILILSTLMFAKVIWFETQQIHRDLEENEPPIVIKYRFRNILLLHQGVAE